MKKPIIGIIAPRKINSERAFENYTKFISNFPKRVLEAGGTPIGMLFPEGKFIKEEADLCDGFIIQGGRDIESTGINVINYAIKNKKPVLGVCLGMQTMAGYEWIITQLGDNPTYEMVDNFYKVEMEDKILKFESNHDKVDPFYMKDIEKSKHDVLLNKQSRLYEIYNNDIIKVPSIHKQAVKDYLFDNSSYFKITGKTNDEVIEVLESKNPDLWIVGVQFHPELESKNTILFKSLIDEAKKI